MGGAGHRFSVSGDRNNVTFCCICQLVPGQACPPARPGAGSQSGRKRPLSSPAAARSLRCRGEVAQQENRSRRPFLAIKSQTPAEVLTPSKYTFPRLRPPLQPSHGLRRFLSGQPGRCLPRSSGSRWGPDLVAFRDSPARGLWWFLAWGLRDGACVLPKRTDLLAGPGPQVCSFSSMDDRDPSPPLVYQAPGLGSLRSRASGHLRSREPPGPRWSTGGKGQGLPSRPKPGNPET